MAEPKDGLDPLIEALPPATDYLTYLTLVEYQLTPSRLPILHQVLQDETLTTNIGWDLVNILLPLLPDSRECLDDVARLGNPREVILRVSEALMKLHAVEDEDKEDEGDEVNDKTSMQRRLPLHILQFNCLLSMLSTLHSRIKTKYASRFVATSLHAVLEAYTEFPSPETTAAMLELLRDMSGKKRPRLPPRSISEQALTRSTGDKAPDPEADEHVEGDLSDVSKEKRLTQKLLQFGLIETLKTYLLQCVDEPAPSGMQWAVRLQEKLNPPRAENMRLTCIEQFQNTEYLRERDTTLGKIVALSRDFGVGTQDLQNIILKGENDHPPPLDFDNIPSSPDEIPLERHGCILLLAARHVTATIFGSGACEQDLPLYPDLVNILLNFLGDYASPYTAAAEEPAALIDSILSLAATAKTNAPQEAADEEGFKTLVYGLTACSRGPAQFRTFTRLGSIPARVFHAYPDIQVRYNLILEILSEEESEYARVSALQWLKEELISYSTNPEDTDGGNPFSEPESFTFLFQYIYKFSNPAQPSTTPHHPEGISSGVWMEFIQDLAPIYLAKLNFYFFLRKSHKLAEQLHISTLQPIFDARFLDPLKSFMSRLSENSVLSHVEAEMGESAVQMGKSAMEVVLQIISDIETAA
ncbi:YAP1-binding protein 1 [Microsporum audouinii]